MSKNHIEFFASQSFFSTISLFWGVGDYRFYDLQLDKELFPLFITIITEQISGFHYKIFCCFLFTGIEYVLMAYILFLALRGGLRICS